MEALWDANMPRDKRASENEQLCRRVGKRWREMNQEDKKPYLDMAVEDKARYHREIEAMKANRRRSRYSTGVRSAAQRALNSSLGMSQQHSSSGSGVPASSRSRAKNSARSVASPSVSGSQSRSKINKKTMNGNDSVSTKGATSKKGKMQVESTSGTVSRNRSNVSSTTGVNEASSSRRNRRKNSLNASSSNRNSSNLSKQTTRGVKKEGKWPPIQEGDSGKVLSIERKGSIRNKLPRSAASFRQLAGAHGKGQSRKVKSEQGNEKEKSKTMTVVQHHLNPDHRIILLKQKRQRGMIGASTNLIDASAKKEKKFKSHSSNGPKSARMSSKISGSRQELKKPGKSRSVSTGSANSPPQDANASDSAGTGTSSKTRKRMQRLSNVFAIGYQSFPEIADRSWEGTSGGAANSRRGEGEVSPPEAKLDELRENSGSNSGSGSMSSDERDMDMGKSGWAITQDATNRFNTFLSSLDDESERKILRAPKVDTSLFTQEVKKGLGNQTNSSDTGPQFEFLGPAGDINLAQGIARSSILSSETGEGLQAAEASDKSSGGSAREEDYESKLQYRATSSTEKILPDKQAVNLCDWVLGSEGFDDGPNLPESLTHGSNLPSA
eukprot:CAMPEP_0167753456 /NCGR_PEP_ID=MMETSP0110_2-20121227/7725_1 /TAXON_ID=629695 /ORGANISM="Gymnochlora sp., Strain CCMP2014" /LENGTH=610 /DNA_ID=CAMNT_0007639227 /DNA_START=126 /DNA_END=1958 /DNA_ORIENTATION=+